MDYSRFCQSISVPRETFEKLSLYVSLLIKWQKQINLISPKDVDHIWERHIIDCCQFALANVPRETSVLDLGSGAGLPGLILSILGFTNVALAESDGRKCVFLEEAARELSVNPHIFHGRIEALPEQKWQMITARGCAPLDQLLTWSSPYLSSSGFCLFAKGERHAIERQEASHHWDYDEAVIPSITHHRSVLVKISNLKARQS